MSHWKFRAAVALAAASFCTVAQAAVLQPDVIVENYCAATRGQEKLVEGATMDVDIAANLPKLKKQGRLHALKKISALGRITYEALRFEGDRTVKNQVISRYLAADAEARQKPGGSLAVTPDNYKFKYKGLSQGEEREVYVFQVTPKRKRQGLFKGEIWIDAATYLRVRESGYLVKSPSIFLKKVSFVRRYQILDGIAVPLEEQSVVDVRFLGVGKAELTVNFSNYSIDGSRRATDGELDIQ